jgi:cytochrome c peroxidase
VAPRPTGPAAPVKRALARAITAAERLDANPDEYLVLREQVAAAAPFFRMPAQLGSEALLGPPRVSDEGTGALGALDAAIRDGDRKAQSEHQKRVVRALRLIADEVELSGVQPEHAMQAMSDACFELGLLLLEASPHAPSSSEGTLAAARGTLSAVLEGARSLASNASKEKLAEVERRVAGLSRALSSAKRMSDVPDRAALVRDTGVLGVTVRKLGRALGRELRLPYRARFPIAENGVEEPVTPFTLPAARREGRGGNEAAIAALGRKLFFERRLSRGDKRACADCHRPNQAYSDGLAVPVSLDPNDPLERNTPSLLYTPLHAAQLWDGRFASPERQALEVIHTVAEMGLDEKELVTVLKGIADYDKTFRALFTDGVAARNVARALAAFESKELVPGTAPIDRFARGEDDALSERARAGLEVFAGAGRCTRCHVPPSFAGSRPNDFAVPVFASLGVPTSPEGKELDRDQGRAAVTKRPIDAGVFKTPTVRNIALTAPYFHHGRFLTLEQVVDFYDKGGGRGLGLEVDNQDPDVRPLKLTPAQKADLLSFMRETLRD